MVAMPHECRGISSSLALLASVVILMAQIALNVAFMKVMSEGLTEVNSVVEELSSTVKPRLVVAKSNGCIIVVNDENRSLVVTRLTLYTSNGSALNLDVHWVLQPLSSRSFILNLGLEPYVVAALEVEGCGRALYRLVEV